MREGYKDEPGVKSLLAVIRNQYEWKNKTRGKIWSKWVVSWSPPLLNKEKN